MLIAATDICISSGLLQLCLLGDEKKGNMSTTDFHSLSYFLSLVNEGMLHKAVWLKHFKVTVLYAPQGRETWT